MALTFHTTAEHREYIDLLYQTYGTGKFQYNDIKDKVPNWIFKKFCDQSFLIKDGTSSYLVPPPYSRCRKKVTVANWKLNMYFIRKYVK